MCNLGKRRVLACCLIAMATTGQASFAADVLDDFDDASAWQALASDQVSSALRSIRTADGDALCLDWNFNGVSGHAAMRRDLPIEFPANYEFDFDIRGSGPANQFEFKLIDASGDNVWWVNRPSTTFPSDWTPVRYKKRHITPAWGPLADKTLRRSRYIEFTVYANAGGKGELCVDDLRFRERPVAPTAWPPPTLSVGKRDGGARPTPTVVADFGRLRETGGVLLHWAPDRHATRYDIEVSDTGTQWRTLRRVVAGNGGIDALALPETEARYLRVAMLDGPRAPFKVDAIEVKDLAFGETPNAFLTDIAKTQPRGHFPRGFSGQQTYWTLVGIDGGHDSGLLGEDGALEVARGGFSIEPFLIAADGKLVAWADVRPVQDLLEDRLPMPGVRWEHQDASLRIDAFAEGTADTSRILASYTVGNDGDDARTLTLVLAIQPFQVNPPVQFLTTPGGVSPINELGFDGTTVSVNGKPRVRPLQAPTEFFATPFDADMAAQHLGDREWPGAQSIKDGTGLASGALVYRIALEPHASRTVTLDIPLSGRPRIPKLPPDALAGWVDTERGKVAAGWREKLDRVTIKVPASAQPIVDTLRTALAHVLINRDGVKIRPGTRSYARSWIRDGAMTSEALLRLGHAAEARAFLEWYAPFQFANGKVPCCVDKRGADPVPENDSHGELVFLAAETARYTQDHALAAAMWPYVDKATRHLDALRASERVEANRGTERYGLLPPSISHEGYSAKPAYSHWDNFWGLIGYDSAIRLAEQLGRNDDARRLSASRDTFRADILDSLDASARKFEIGFIPGAADLGDFDATSTTIALSPGGELEHLPRVRLTNTIERYWREFVERRDGGRQWKDYTPYEWRNVSAFIRLGWRTRAHEAIAYFFKDRRPEAWNQWAEVVGRDYREPRFIGDMPHGWVASDFIRAALDLFAYERVSDQSLVLAGGVLPQWLDGDGIAIDGLHTPYGVIGYSLRRHGDNVVLSIRGDAKRVPPGGFVFVWPDDSSPGRTRINRRNAQWKDRELRISTLPAEVVVATSRKR